MGSWLRRYMTLTLAVALGGVLTIPFINGAVQFIRDAIDPSRVDLEVRSVFAQMGLSTGSGELGVGSMIAGVVVGVISLVTLVALAGIAFRRQWAREAGIGLFVAFAVVVTPLAISGLVADPPARNAGIGLMVGLASAVVVVLLAVPPTSLAFDLAELHRRRGRSD